MRRAARVHPPLTQASLLHFPDLPFAYGLSRSRLRVVLRAPAGAVDGGIVAYNDRYAWSEEDDDWAALDRHAPLTVYARDGELEYWFADLELHPPRLRYRFGLDTADGRRWFGWDGLGDAPRPRGSFEFAYVAEGDVHELPEWARGAVFYQIFPDRFAIGPGGPRRAGVEPWHSPPRRDTFLGGDLDGIRARLDHVASIGADALYLTPIFSAPSNHRYDTADFFNVAADLGGNEALRRLVDALHERGMRLVLDGVYNHVGATWPPFVDALTRGADSPHAGWFYLDGDMYETWGPNVTSLPKLRTSHPDVRELVCRVGRFWIDQFGIDGWRLDVADEVDHALWKDYRRAVRGARRDALLVGEIWGWAMPWLRGDELDSVMNYPLRRSILRFAAAGSRAIDKDGPLDADGLLNTMDRLRAAYPERVLPYLYNLLGSHDEQRPLTALAGDRAALVVAAGLLFTLPGIASVYYGDEVGLEGGKDPDNRRGMEWAVERQDASLLGVYRSLGGLRRALPVLRHGRYERLDAQDDSGSVAAFARVHDGQRVVVLANAGRADRSVARRQVEAWLGGRPELVASLAYRRESAVVEGAALHLPGQSVSIVRPLR